MSCAICPLLGKVLVTKGAKMCYVSFYSLLYRISHYLVKEAYRQVSKGKILGSVTDEDYSILGWADRIYL